jgi:hypothetical protein
MFSVFAMRRALLQVPHITGKQGKFDCLQSQTAEFSQASGGKARSTTGPKQMGERLMG